MTSSDSRSASDSTISTAPLDVPATTRSSLEPSSWSRQVGFRTYSPFDVSDAGSADRVRRTGCRKWPGRRKHPIIAGNIAVDLGITGHQRADDLHFVHETLREQRPDRTIDQPAGEGFLLGRTAFSLEEAPGNAPRGVKTLLVVDRQRKPGLARVRLPASRSRRTRRRCRPWTPRRRRYRPGGPPGPSRW